MNVYRSSDFSTKEKLHFFEMEVNDLLQRIADSPAGRKIAVDELTTKARDIIESLPNHTEQQKVLTKLNQKLRDMGANTLVLGSSSSNTAAKVRVQREKIEGASSSSSSSTSSLPPPPSYLEARLDDLEIEISKMQREANGLLTERHLSKIDGLAQDLIGEFAVGTPERHEVEEGVRKKLEGLYIGRNDKRMNGLSNFVEGVTPGLIRAKAVNWNVIDWDALNREVRQLTHEKKIKELQANIFECCKAMEDICFANQPINAEAADQLKKLMHLLWELNNRNFRPLILQYVQLVNQRIKDELMYSQIKNDRTFLFQEVIREVYVGYLFVSKSGHGFDVNELVILMDREKRLYNPYTREEFEQEDLENLKKFPRIKEHVIFRRIVNPEAARIYEENLQRLASKISRHTEDRIRDLVEVLKISHWVSPESDRILEEKGKAVFLFRIYFQGLSREEQDALMELSRDNTFMWQVDIAHELKNLIDGGCSSGCHQYFESILNHLKRVRANS